MGLIGCGWTRKGAGNKEIYILAAEAFWSHGAKASEIKLASYFANMLARARRTLRRTRNEGRDCYVMKTTDLIYRNHGYSLDTRFYVPWDERRDIRHRQNSNHTLQTSSILACVSGCTREEIRMRHPFCRDHEASVCRRWRRALVRVDERAKVLEAGSSGQRVSCDAVGSGEGRGGSLRG